MNHVKRGWYTGAMIPDLDDPSELIQWSREKSIEDLSNLNECIEQAVGVFFQNLGNENKKTYICLSVFVGNFQRNLTKEIINESRLRVENLIERLVR